MTETDIVSRVYHYFKGVDFRGEGSNLYRSPDSLNMWKDYKETESIRTRPGMKLHTAFSEPVYGVFFFNDILIVHSGEKLYRVTGGSKSVLFTGANKAESNSFVYENVWYFKDGKNYLQYDGSTIKAVVGYIPTTSIGRKPGGGGTVHEDVNMLSYYRKNTFLADGESFDFHLDAREIDSDYKPICKVNGESVTAFSVDYAKGIVSFTKAPDAPLTDGQDNVEIQFRKTVEKQRNSILNCTLLQVFDNRVFFSGNKDYPATVWHCSLNDPAYISDLDYYNEGLDNARVKGLVAGNNALWVFREPSDANTTVFYHTPTLDSEYGKIYPSQHSSVTTGCVGKAINFNDDIIFFSERGMEGISGDVTTEQVVGHRSSLVDRKMIAEPDYAKMVLEEWEGYLFVFIGNMAYLADSRTAWTNQDHIEYEWFLWDMKKKITCARVEDGILYLGTEDGVYTMTDHKAEVESYWTTPKDRFKYPHRQKTTSKKSCTVEAEGEEIVISAMTNKDEDFAILGTFQAVEDAISCRVKKKKFKDIQLKFYSPKRFSLESATLECYIGGYLKNL